MTSITARIRELQQMTVGELRDEYRRVFGEEPRSHHKQFLWKRIAWRIQALAEGDLSERARQRAEELADDAQIRIRAPRGAFDETAPARTRIEPFAGGRDRRLPLPGTVLTREYKGRTLRVMVLDEGFEFEGTAYRSLSAVATAVTGARWNGYHFFGIDGKGSRA